MRKLFYVAFALMVVFSGCKSLQDVDIIGKYYNATFYNLDNANGYLRVYSFYEDYRYEGHVYSFENKQCVFRDSISGRWQKLSNNRILLLSDTYLKSDNLAKMVGQIAVAVGNSAYSFNDVDTLYIKDENTIAHTDKYINPYIRGVVW